MVTRREILATINATTRETGYERILADDFLYALRSDNIDALDAALLDLACVALTPGRSLRLSTPSVARCSSGTPWAVVQPGPASRGGPTDTSHTRWPR